MKYSEVHERFRQQCDRDDPHDEHSWNDADENKWWCRGRKAHINTMIGREG